MRAQKQQQQQTKQALGGTLKAFVRVGKATDAPAGKAAVRMTRSKSAAAVATTKTAVGKAEAASKTKAKANVTVATAVGGKRKLAEESATPEPEEPAAKKRAAGRRKTTTIDAYFAPMEEVVVEAAKPAEPMAAAPAMLPVAEKTTVEPATNEEEETTQESAQQEHEQEQETEQQTEKTAERDARATALLGRLRARHSAAAAKTADSAAAGSSMHETRAIQEALRARRQDDSAAPAAPTPAPATFAATRVASETFLHQREQRRQFVEIAVAPASTRKLPRNLAKLSSLFQALEHTLLFAPQQSVQKGVVYHKVRKSVEVMARWTFGWKELGQILSVYPEAYTCERTEAVVAGRPVVSALIKPTVQAGVQMAVEMEQRRGEFALRLGRLVEGAYGAFLARRGFTGDEVRQVQGAVWHPEFDVEETPDVAPVAMPPPAVQLPAFDRERLRHLLGKAEESKAAAAESEAPKPASVALPTPTDSPVLTPHTDPSSAAAAKPKPSGSAAASALLARIRAKQQQAKHATVGSVVGRATQSMHSRLPGVVEAVSFMFYQERKSSLPFALVAEKIAESRGLDLGEAAGHLLALARLVPEWCAVLDEKGERLEDPAEAPQGARLKITRAISMQEAKTRLAAKLPPGQAAKE
ncbi:replication licensing factor Cdt1 [Coemansia erecta]|uniref:Replication licensing factor Cdt1 n=1 Tax=Coemansia erecta TaxID=147472 RepID=A0A9W7Y4V3_9FUNG|nr:replication licensing factor Cdt1 [Coemansia erecta]